MGAETSQGKYNTIAKWVIVFAVAVYVIPILILGQNSYIRLHDTLEGEWVWLKLLADSHTAFNFSADAIVPQVMKGQPRNVYPSGLSLNMVLVQLLGAFKAYMLSSLLIRIAGFIGFALLLKDYFIREFENRYIVWLCALTFSVISVFTPFGLSVMGQPLLLWAFLNLQNSQKRIMSYLIIALFPFYSSIVWMAVPFMALLGLVGVYFYFNAKLNRNYVIGFALLAIMFLVANVTMLAGMFGHADFMPHRAAYNLYMFHTPGFVQSLTETITVFVTTHYHIATYITLATLIAVLLVIKKTDRVLMAVVLGIVAVCLFQGFYSYFEYALGDKIGLIKSFRFNRFSILLPMLWLLALALSLHKMSGSKVFKPLIIPFIACQLFLAFGGNDEVLHNYRTLTGHQKFPGYNNYLAPVQFKEIKDYIAMPQESYYVASLGISPSIAQYNGFYTLDGLMSVYDLRYKQQFRKIFAGEIDKSEDIQQYFDGWGNRCYIFSSELGISHTAFTCYANAHRHVEHLDFNAQAFSSMGGKYLISAVEVKNSEEVGLHLDRVFTNAQSWWTVYLYKVNS